MSDDKFRVWEFANAQPVDSDVRRDFGLRSDSAGAKAGAGAADPAAIDFSWHQRNFEDAIAALRDKRTPAIDGHEGRRAVALINAIYRSAESGGERQEMY